MTEEELEKLKYFRTEFEKIKNNPDLNVRQKNYWYANLMTCMETTFYIPLLEFQLVDYDKPKVIELYREISFSRIF